MIEWKTDAAVLPLIGMAQEQPSSGQQLQQWLLANKDEIDQLLHAHGALLFRGFGVASVEEFQDIASVFCNEFGSYVGGNSPRTKVASHVFTSTEYPKEERISMHNEASYLKYMPGRILFFCLKPAAKGGATPLADCRRVLSRIDPQVCSRFDRSGIRYVNNLHGGMGLGKSWMETYCTEDRKKVENVWKPMATLSSGGRTAHSELACMRPRPRVIQRPRKRCGSIRRSNGIRQVWTANYWRISF